MQIRQNILANGLSYIWTTIISIAFVPLYIRSIGIESYALIGIFAMLQTWLSLLDMGFSPAVGREMAKLSGQDGKKQHLLDLLRSIEVVFIGFAAFIIVTVWLVSDWLATDWLKTDSLDHETVALAFIAMSLVIALRTIENLYRSSLLGLQKQVGLGIITSFIATFRAVGAYLVLVNLSSSITAYFYWQVFASILSLVVSYCYLYSSIGTKNMSGNFSLTALKSLWSFGAGVSLITISGLVLSQIDKLIITKLISLREFGYYSLAYLVASTTRTVVQPIYEAVYPKLTQLVHEKNFTHLALIYHKANQFSVVLLGSIGIFIGVYAEQILFIWTKDYELSHHTASVLMILVAGMVLNGCMNGPYYLQMAFGWTSLLVRLNFLLLVLFCPAIFICTLKFGIEGAASVWLVLNFTYLLVVANFMHKKLLPNEKWNWYLDDLIKPLAMPLIVAIILKVFTPSNLTVNTQIMTMVLSYLFILFLSIISAPLLRKEIIIKYHDVIRRYE